MPAHETVSSLETQALSLSCVLLCPQPQAQGGLTILVTCSRPPNKPGLALRAEVQTQLSPSQQATLPSA